MKKKHTNQKIPNNVFVSSAKKKRYSLRPNQRSKRSPSDGISSKDTAAGSFGKLRTVANDPRCGDVGEKVEPGDVGDVGDGHGRRSG